MSAQSDYDREVARLDRLELKRQLDAKDAEIAELKAELVQVRVWEEQWRVKAAELERELTESRRVNVGLTEKWGAEERQKTAAEIALREIADSDCCDVNYHINSDACPMKVARAYFAKQGEKE